jgi:uncharacterized hydrophobic protein (TIGR00271 family)
MRLPATTSWLNPTSAKGLVFVLSGLFVLAAPQVALPSLRVLLAGTLLVVAISNLWGHALVRDSAHGRSRALLAAAAAAGMLMVPHETLRTIELIFVAYLASIGVLAVRRGLSGGGDGDSRVHIGSGMTLFAAAFAIFALPNEVISLTVVAGALTAVMMGLLMLKWGLSPRADSLEVTGRGFASEVLQHWLGDRDVGTERREAIAETLYFEGPERRQKVASYVTMLALSVAIASLAVLQDSTAVIIGAMLIATLMAPIMGCAAGLVAGWRNRVVTSLGVVFASVASAVGLAWILASWIPGLVPLDANSQVLSRASPTLLDMAVALAAGAAGAYATVDKRVSQSLTGVAVAVALVPPLSVVGVALEAGRIHAAGGAFLLFATNLVSIIVASAVVFVLVGFSPARKILEDRKTIADLMSAVAVAAILIMVPLGLSGRGIIEASQRYGRVHEEVGLWLGPDSTLKLDRIDARPGEATILLSGSGEVPDIAGLEQALAQSLGRQMSVTVEYFSSVIVTSGGQASEAEAPVAGWDGETPPSQDGNNEGSGVHQ